MTLPIYEIEGVILDALRRGNRLIVSAPTGSGKSTQVPQILHDHRAAGPGEIVVLQPRRIAARLLARRVAFERKSELGREVGYQVRFENVVSRETRIRFVTEGVLLRQMLEDPALRGVSAVIFDEFHERHLYGDITLAQALELQAGARPDLKVLVMSATLDAAQLEAYLHPCEVLQSEGRTHSVETRYASLPSYADTRTVWDQAADAFAQFVDDGGQGDVLVFMPGGFEIAQTIGAIRRKEQAQGFVVLPLHGELPPQEQDAAVARYDHRKVVVSTNVAETSLTIDGIRCVIDSGLARMARYDPHRGINTLLIEPISRASADQRTGRAGRTAPGLCQRLWSQDEHSHRPPQETPEVKRLDLAEVVLTLKASGVGDLRQFRWLEPPTEAALSHAEELLADLGAITAHGGAPPGGNSTITGIGRKMLAFPLHPRYARMLLAAQDYGCVDEACLVAALTQGRDLLIRNADAATQRQRQDTLGDNTTSDFWTQIRAWEYASKHECSPAACQRMGVHAPTARQVGPLYRQFVEIARREGLETTRRAGTDDRLRKCLLIGFSDRVARRIEGTPRCELVHGRRGSLARESVVQQSQLLVAAEVSELEGKDKTVQTVLSMATAIEESWLDELFPADISATVRVFYDATIRRVCAEEHRCFRGLSLSARRVEPPPKDEAARLLANEVLAGRLPLTEWDQAVEQWILRVNLLARVCPELGLAPIGDEERRHIVEELCHGAFGYKDVKDKPVLSAVRNWLSPAHQGIVDKHAPERLSLSNGKTPRITYETGNPPHVALRIQELFGVTNTPAIAKGRIPVVLHILAPSMRPVQITTDLPGFWREHYPRIKQELRRKYPKHKWP